MEKNPIETLSSVYKRGEIEKYEYIEKMQSFNKTLFYFSERLKSTDIQRIEIQDDLLVFTTRKDGIKLVFNGVDRRGVPFDILNFECYEKEDETVLFSLVNEDAVIFDIGATKVDPIVSV